MSTWYTCTQCGALFCVVSDTGKSLSQPSRGSGSGSSEESQEEPLNEISTRYVNMCSYILHYFHMTVYNLPSGQVACGAEGRVPRLHLCLHCACKFFLRV